MEDSLLSDTLILILWMLPLAIPVWKIHSKAGMRPVLSLLVFVPYIGLLLTTTILAFSRWPATDRSNASTQWEGTRQ